MTDETKYEFDLLDLIDSNGCGCGWTVESFHVPTKNMYFVKYFYWCKCHHGEKSLWTKNVFVWRQNGVIQNILNNDLISKEYCDASPL